MLVGETFVNTTKALKCAEIGSTFGKTGGPARELRSAFPIKSSHDLQN